MNSASNILYMKVGAGQKTGKGQELGLDMAHKEWSFRKHGS